MKKIIPILLLVVVIAGINIYNRYGPGAKEDDGLLYGTVEATQVKLSAEVMGQVLEMHAEEGDKIEKGQTLVLIDSEAMSHQLAQAEAAGIAAQGQYQAVNASISGVKTELNRGQNLLGAGSISDQQFDQIDTQNKALKGQRTAAWGMVQQAKATADYVRTQIEKATVQSPIDGVVLEKNIEVGEMAMPGSALLTLADLENCWVRVYVPETELGKVKLGQSVRIFSDSYPGKHYEGKVTMISSEAEFTPKNVQTKQERVRLVYGVKVSVHNPDGELKIGMPVDAEIME